jgi:hypothetical protein
MEMIAEKGISVSSSAALIMAWYWSRNDYRYRYHLGYGDFKHHSSGILDYVYDCLIKLGYPMGADEQAYRDGTHPLFDGIGEEQFE